MQKIMDRICARNTAGPDPFGPLKPASRLDGGTSPIIGSDGALPTDQNSRDAQGSASISASNRDCRIVHSKGPPAQGTRCPDRALPAAVSSAASAEDLPSMGRHSVADPDEGLMAGGVFKGRPITTPAKS